MTLTDTVEQTTSSTYSEALRIIKDARQKILDPKHWTQKAYARRNDRHKTDWWSKAAVCWCSTGAVHASANTEEHIYSYKLNSSLYLAREVLEWAAKTILKGSVHSDISFSSVIDLNDGTDHTTVIQMFDSAIALMENRSKFTDLMEGLGLNVL